MTDFTEPIVISIIGGSIAVLSLIFRLMYKSKCDTIEIGCIKIHRNTAQEIQQQDSMTDVKI